MFKHRILLILEGLEAADWKQLELFLVGEWSSGSRLAVDLFAILKARHFSGKSLNLEKEALFELLYPGESLVPQRLRRVAMELMEAVKDFWLHQEARAAHWLEREVAQLRALLQRKQYPVFAQLFPKVLHKALSEPEAGQAFQLAFMELRRLENEFIIHTGKEEDTFEAFDQALDRFYLLNKLENAAAMSTREKRFPQQHQVRFEAEITGMAQQIDPHAWPEVALWQSVWELEQGGSNWESYRAVEKHLEKAIDRLTLLKLRQVRGYQINFLNRNTRTDVREDYLRCWKMVRMMWEEGTIFLNGRLSEPFLRMAIRYACLAGEVDWGHAFLEAEQAKFVGLDRQQVLSEMQVLLSLYRGEFEQVLRQTAMLKYAKPRFEVVLRICRIKALYALDRSEDYFLAVEAFQKLLQRQGILSQRVREAHKDFVRCALKLGRSRFGGGAAKGLADFIRRTKASEKLWLLEQAAAFGGCLG